LSERTWPYSVPLLLALVAGCAEEPRLSHVPLGPKELPAESYERPPEVPFDRSDYVVRIEQMTSFYDVPGEAGYYLPGEDYGFEALSFIITETHPHGGPPLHTHDTEEAHILLSGRMDYVIGDRRFTADAPYVARIPAGAPHTFLNSGSSPLNLIAAFPSKKPDYQVIGPNPLVPE
jgi:mannose-6-phosphate isomerase-like protein (cupin superfamily)